ncbi:MAG: MASE3 domain-containing protein, partial [Anaerolineaceae bacterium]|nr:MASE3 domain-containing protein [Anaerolineaceae bacterium]
MQRVYQTIQPYLAIPLGIAILASLYIISLNSYLLFHSLVELFSIVVAFSIFIVAWNTRDEADNGYLLFTGIAFLFFSSLDAVHTLSYKGMGIFPWESADLPTQLWIAARYLQAGSLLVAPFFLRRKVPIVPVISVYFIVTALLFLSIFAWKIFPVCYIDAVGLTAFKRTSEYIISLMLAGAISLLWQRRNDFDPGVVRLLILALVASIASELAFTEYVNVYSIANLIGHMLKIIAFYLIYRAIIVTCLVQPYTLLFRNLKHSEEALRSLSGELEIRVQERTAELSQANLELGRYRTHLEELVAERTAELQKEIAERRRAQEAANLYAAQLERVNRELHDFASIASHDLQDPLRKIQAFGQRLSHLAGDEFNETGRDYLERMMHSARRMQEMVSGLLEYSRVTTRAQPFEPVDLNQVTSEVISDLELRIDQETAQVEVVTLPAVEADPLQMRQLLQNLISNALKFHRDGVAPVVRVSGCVEPGDNGEDATVHIRVEDNGIGFDERFVERIFQPFQRLVGQSEFEGSGIGLATCRKIVERHGGSLTARSVP